eukprot:Anaeramoba_ignava/a217771_236.p1 GENE.a217771_236~~a217771_236.p1  ORF type:complete len:167 (-),score=63.58 a217771_236:52-486(-)
MKTHQTVSSSRRKSRKAHFTAPPSERRIKMSSRLSSELRAQYNIRSLPIRNGDEVKIMRGDFKSREGKVVNVVRKKYVVHIERIQKEKKNGQQYFIPIHPSNVMITKLKINGNRQKLLERKNRAKNAEKNKPKIKQSTNMSEVD